MIFFNNITKVYLSPEKPIIALQDVSFEIKKGDFVSVVGKSGAGKTTLVKLIIGEEKPTKGSLLFDDIEIPKLNPSSLQKVRRRIGVVHQDYKLLNAKTVGENLGYIMQAIGVSDEGISRDVPQVLEVVGLGDRICNFPGELSGGEKQRLAIARALIHRPDLIIADEPTGNLDLYNTYEIIEIFKKINEAGVTLILLTHDKDVVNALRRRVITLEHGKIVSDEANGTFIL